MHAGPHLVVVVGGGGGGAFGPPWKFCAPLGDFNPSKLKTVHYTHAREGGSIQETPPPPPHLSQEQQGLGTFSGLVIGVSIAVMKQSPLQLHPLYKEIILHHHDVANLCVQCSILAPIYPVCINAAS